MIRRFGRALLVSGIALLAFPAQSFVPQSHRVIDAVADANVSGHRVGALRFDLKLRIGDGPPVATGELVTHPTGMARLELRANGGLVERHILQGNQHSAARNNRMLLRPRAFLPPLFVLQSSSSAILEAALASLGVEPELIGLAPCGDDDCYVLGDPARAVRGLPEPVADMQDAVEESGDDRLDSDQAPTGQGLTKQVLPKQELPEENEVAHPPAPRYFANLWVQTSDHVVRRVELRNGVKIELGPYVSFEKVLVPQWWSIEEPGKRVVRFEVDGVVPVSAPAAAFSQTWLMAPVTPNPAPPGQLEARGPAPGEAGIPTNP